LLGRSNYITGAHAGYLREYARMGLGEDRQYRESDPSALMERMCLGSGVSI